MKIYILNGPNINMLGIREPELYGKENYESLVKMAREHAEAAGFEPVFFQSNHEGELVDKIQEAYFEGAFGIVINPAAYTHTSVAILDALKATKLPFVEVHISDVNAREDFRKKSFVREAALKTVSGFGLSGYLMAIDFLKDLRDER